jgi:hypothetical protein
MRSNSKIEPSQECPGLHSSDLPAGITFSLYGNRYLAVPVDQMIEVRNSEINFAGSEIGRHLVQEALDKLINFFNGLPATFDVVFLQTQKEIAAVGLNAPDGIIPVVNQLVQSDGNQLVAYMEHAFVPKLCDSNAKLSPED